MSEDRLQSLEARLGRLEEENQGLRAGNRRLKWFGLAGVLVMAGGLFMGLGGKGDVIQGKEFRLYGPKGNMRLKIDVGDDGARISALTADNKKVQFQITPRTFSLRDENGTTRAAMGVQKDGDPILRLLKSDGKTDAWKAP